MVKRCKIGLLIATLVLGWWFTQRAQPAIADGGGPNQPQPQSQQPNVFDDMVKRLVNPDPGILFMPQHNPDPQMVFTPNWPPQDEEASPETEEN